MIPQDEAHEWSAEALLNKAQSYSEEMLSFPHDDWRFALWSTLSLELLNQYQGGMCISGVLTMTDRTPQLLISPLGTNCVGTDSAVLRYVHFTLALV